MADAVQSVMSPRSRIIFGLGGVAIAVGAACGGTRSTSDAAAFGCCPLPSKPNWCTLVLGGVKHSADDSCIRGYDGSGPDPDGPGWTVVNDNDGGPTWKPGPNTPGMACGPKRDAGHDADANDASDDGGG